MPLIDPGQRAPRFTLRDQRGEKWALRDALAAGRTVVLFFYPKDDTPGCTREACGFRDTARELMNAGAVVVGVSPQGVASKAAFAEKHALGFPVLADERAAVCEKYGVWQEKRMYGRTFMGVVRTTYIIAPSGVVAERFDRVKVPGHAERVLAAIGGVGSAGGLTKRRRAGR